MRKRELLDVWRVALSGALADAARGAFGARHWRARSLAAALEWWGQRCEECKAQTSRYACFRKRRKLLLLTGGWQDWLVRAPAVDNRPSRALLAFGARSWRSLRLSGALDCLRRYGRRGKQRRRLFSAVASVGRNGAVQRAFSTVLDHSLARGLAAARRLAADSHYGARAVRRYGSLFLLLLLLLLLLLSVCPQLTLFA